MMTKIANVMPLLEWLNEGMENGKELEVLHVNSEVLHDTGVSFAVLFIEVAEAYIKN